MTIPQIELVHSPHSLRIFHTGARGNAERGGAGSGVAWRLLICNWLRGDRPVTPYRERQETIRKKDKRMDSGSHMNLDTDRPLELEPTSHFMMNCLMYSRLETNIPSNRDYFDEDVNVYLANLLTSFMHPQFHERSKKYLSRYDSSLFDKVKNSRDVRPGQ